MTRFSSLISVFVSLIGFAACGASEVVSLESDAGTVALDSDGRTPVGDVAGKDRDYQAVDSQTSNDTVGDEADGTSNVDEAVLLAEADTFEAGEDTKEVSKETHDDTVVDSDNSASDETQTIETEDDTADDANDGETADDIESDEVTGDVANDEVTVDLICVPDCAGKECGSDGCGGSCGVCNDGVDCTTDICNTTTHQCDYVPNHALCNDSNICNGMEKCAVGIGCQVGVSLNCDDNNQCTDDICQNGLCINTPLPDWTPCELDGLACSVDNCWSGTCQNMDFIADFDTGVVTDNWSVYTDDTTSGNVSTVIGNTSSPYAFVAQGFGTAKVILIRAPFYFSSTHTAQVVFDYKNNFGLYQLGTVFTVNLTCYDDTTGAWNSPIILLEVIAGTPEASEEKWIHYSIDLSPYTGYCSIGFDFAFPGMNQFWHAIDTIQLGCL